MKRQELRVTKASVAVALAYAVISSVEDAVEDEDAVGSVSVDRLALEASPRPGSTVRVRVSVPGVEGVIGDRELEAVNVRVIVESVPDYMGDYGLSTLYRSVAMMPIRKDSRLLRELALETTRNGVEFLLLYLDSGYVALLEGDIYRVRIPFVRAAASYHTHPEGHCGLSLKDLESGLDLLVSGGVGEASATPSCAAVMYRVGFVTEDDYIELRKVIIKGGGTVPRGLESIRFEVVRY